MAVRMSKNPHLLYVDDYDNDEVFAKIDIIEPRNRGQATSEARPQTQWLHLLPGRQNYLKLSSSPIKHPYSKESWCKFLLISMIFLYGICGLSFALSEKEPNLLASVALYMLGSVLILVLVYMVFRKCKKDGWFSNEIKVSRVFNKNNADEYIDIDY